MATETQNNLNDQYKADMIRHNLWMANAQRQREEFEKTMRQIDADTARAEKIVDEPVPSEPCGFCDGTFPAGSEKCSKCSAVRDSSMYIAPNNADVERFLAESCEGCGNHPPTEGHEKGCKLYPAAKCPGYGCDSVIGNDGGIIDGDRYCAGCVADEARVSARAKGGR